MHFPLIIIIFSPKKEKIKKSFMEKSLFMYYTIKETKIQLYSLLL